MPDSAALPCLALAGPTASGKTAAALALAERHPIEVISVDSALVYRGMDVGTAKPSAAELAQVPHHLIDIRDPLQAYSAAEFVRDVQALLPAIRARGAQPVLVGGTMLYFKALMEGLDPMPAAQPALRAALEAEAAERGWPALHAELGRVDPDTAARLAPHDAQRIQRALEVYRATGQTLSHFHAGRAGRAEPGVPLVLLSLEPEQRSWLHERIGRRFHEMLAQGLIGEVQRLRDRGDLNADLPSMRCVGYRQAWEALEGTLPMAELADRGIFATRQLAKRQLTWLRSMPQRQVIAADAPDALSQVLARAEAVLTQPLRPPN